MKPSLFHHDQLTEPLDIYCHNMHYLKVNVIGNISSLIHFFLRQIFNPFILHFLENCWNFSETSVKLGVT